MMRRLFLQAVLVCVLTALAAIPASAGLTTDPLGNTGVPLAIVTGTAPGGGPQVCDAGDNCPGSSQGNPQPAPLHITGDGGDDIFPGAPEVASITGGNGQDPVHQGNTQAAPAHITGDGAINIFFGPIADDVFPGNVELAPAPSITGGNGQDPIAPRSGTQAAPAPITGDGATNVYYGPIADTLHVGPALAAAPQIASGPQVVHLDGGCDDDQICGGMDDDQLIGWDDEALHSGNSQTAPALVSGDGANNVFYGPIDDGSLHQNNPQATPTELTGDVDGDGFADNDCDGM